MLLLILASSFLISLIAFVGVFSLSVKDEVLDRILLCLIGFAAGALIGGAFLHLLPETVEKSTSINVFLALSFGFFLFFLLEKLLWRHCHKAKCKVHPFAYINLIGDGVHNEGSSCAKGEGHRRKEAVPRGFESYDLTYVHMYTQLRELSVESQNDVFCVNAQV